MDRNLLKVVLLAVTLFFVFWSSAAAAEGTYSEKYGPFVDQPIDKEWTVKFNEEVLANSVEENIYVATDREGNHRLNNEIAVTGDSVSVLPPAEGYAYGRTYYLFVDAGVQNAELEPVKTQMRASFTIQSEDDQLQDSRTAAIQSKWETLKPVYTGNPYSVDPVIRAPYHSGVLQRAYLVDALNMTNFVRYLAYLPDNVVLNNSFTEEAQAAAVVLAANNQLSHYPAKPSDMDQAFYEKGYLGAGSSNIAMGFENVISSIRYGYMSDSDANNINQVGHRRWILSPRMKEVGFGIARKGFVNYHYTAMKVFASGMYDNSQPAYEFIAWPSAAAFPSSFFPGNDPWSISLNTEQFDESRTDEVRVTLTRHRDQKTWQFSKNNYSSGFFNVDTGDSGDLGYTVIFRPNGVEAYSAGEEYTVTVSGLYKHSGEAAVISYTTTFFSLNE